MVCRWGGLRPPQPPCYLVMHARCQKQPVNSCTKPMCFDVHPCYADGVIGHAQAPTYFVRLKWCKMRRVLVFCKRGRAAPPGPRLYLVMQARCNKQLVNGCKKLVCVCVDCRQCSGKGFTFTGPPKRFFYFIRQAQGKTQLIKGCKK